MSRRRVVVWEHIDESGIELLNSSHQVETIYFDGNPISEAESYSALEEASAVMIRIMDFTREMMQKAPKLEIIAKHGVGYDNIDVASATEMKIPVTITPHGNADAVADHAMAFILSLSRNLHRADTDLKTGRLSRRENYTGLELGGKTIGIIGLGRIGSRVAKRCAQGFGMTVLAYDPFISVADAEKHRAELVNELETLLETSDYVTIHTPLTALTKNMIDERTLRLMKPDAMIINTARGGIIDEAALYQGLKNRWIRGAGLDVYVEEPPLPDRNPLLELDNILVSPHIAGGTKESMVKTATQAAKEILRVFSGEQPKHSINPEIYDASSE